MLRFNGFELDARRLELRDAAGQAVPLRRKSFDLLALLAARAGEVLTRDEIAAAIWPSLHVGQDSLYQCIREIRMALGDEEHALLKVVQGRGYLLDVAVEAEAAPVLPGLDLEQVAMPSGVAVAGRRPGRGWALAAAGLAAALAVVATWSWLALAPGLPPSLLVQPFSGPDAEPETAVARAVHERLNHGLAGVSGVTLLGQAEPGRAGPPQRADLLLSGSLQRAESGFVVRARLLRRADEQVVWSVEQTVPAGDGAVLHDRLAAAVGYPLAQRLPALMRAQSRSGDGAVAVEQALATVVRASRERSETAVALLEKALAEQPKDIDLKVALAAQLSRGVQTSWYSPGEVPAVTQRATSLLAEVHLVDPDYLPLLQANCRLVSTREMLTEAVLACAKALSFNPWDGASRYQLGLAQIKLGRFEDALASFLTAERGDQPAASRWTWLLGAGWAHLTLDNPEETVRYVEKSIALSNGTGRSHFLLANALYRLGRVEEARQAVATGFTLRPHMTIANAHPVSPGQSPSYTAHTARNAEVLRALGVPDGVAGVPSTTLSQAADPGVASPNAPALR